MPTPVPASMMMRSPSLIASVTACAICTCSARTSKPGRVCERAPPSPSREATISASMGVMFSCSRRTPPAWSLREIRCMSSPLMPMLESASASRTGDALWVRGLAAMPLSRYESDQLEVWARRCIAASVRGLRLAASSSRLRKSIFAAMASSRARCGLSCASSRCCAMFSSE